MVLRKLVNQPIRNGGHGLYRGDYNTQLYGDCNRRHEIRIPFLNNQDDSWNVNRVWFTLLICSTLPNFPKLWNPKTGGWKVPAGHTVKRCNAGRSWSRVTWSCRRCSSWKAALWWQATWEKKIGTPLKGGVCVYSLEGMKIFWISKMDGGGWCFRWFSGCHFRGDFQVKHVAFRGCIVNDRFNRQPYP